MVGERVWGRERGELLVVMGAKRGRGKQQLVG